MPRVSKGTFQRSWIFGFFGFLFIGIITIIFTYLPFINEFNRVDKRTTLLELGTIGSSCVTENQIRQCTTGLSIGNFSILDILDLTVLTIIALIILPAYYYRKDYIWRQKADEYLPFLLREISDAQKVGLPLPRAIIEAAKRQYGPLTEELHKMAAKISWGIPFSIGLRSMQKNINTPLFDRTSVLILEAEKSGGETSDIFDSAYQHVNELLGLQRERLSSMAPYRWIIIVAFLVFSIVIVILLNTFFAQLAIQTAEIEASGEDIRQFGGIPLSLAGMQLLFYHLLIIEGFFAGLIAAKMSVGSLKTGLTNSIFLLLVAWIIFKIGVILL